MPPGGPPSTSSASVVAATGPCRRHPQGGHHRHLQLWWWLLSDLAASTPRGPTIDVFSFGGGRCQTLPLAPPGRPPSTSSTSEVAAAGSCCQHPQGARLRQILKWFCDTSTGASTGATRCGSFVRKAFSLLVVSYR
jgi:hypothetical protein